MKDESDHHRAVRISLPLNGDQKPVHLRFVRWKMVAGNADDFVIDLPPRSPEPDASTTNSSRR